jgi:hypothetical protein
MIRIVFSGEKQVFEKSLFLFGAKKVFGWIGPDRLILYAECGI